MLKGRNNILRQSFRGRVFDVNYLDLGAQIDGNCEDENELIEINTRLRGKEKLETEVHESLHACFPMLAESIIEPAAADIAVFLWDLGYRLK